MDIFAFCSEISLVLAGLESGCRRSKSGNRKSGADGCYACMGVGEREMMV